MMKNWSEILLKILTVGGFSPYSFCPWNLPRHGRPGRWMPLLRGKMRECEYGYHLLRPSDFIEWICNTNNEYGGGSVYLAEAGWVGSIGRKDAYDKVVVRSARLVRKLRWGVDAAELLFTRIRDETPHAASCGGEYYDWPHRPSRAHQLHIYQGRMWQHRKELELQKIIMETLGV